MLSPFCALVYNSDYLFPMIGVRFIALNDGVDTLHSDNDIMPFRNLLKNTRRWRK